MSAVSSARGSRVEEHQRSSVATLPRASQPQPSPLHSVVTNIVTTTTTAIKAATLPAPECTTGSSKALTGTLIGAAAGATIAYVMMKAEQPPSPPQPEETHRATVSHRYIEAPPTPQSAIPRRRRGSFTSSRTSGSTWDSGVTYVRAIEAPASAYALDRSSSGTEGAIARALPAPRSARPPTVSTAWTRGSDLAPAPGHVSGTTSKSHQRRSPQRETVRSAHIDHPATLTINAAESSPASPTIPSVRRSATDGPTSLVARSAGITSAASASTVRPLTRVNVEQNSAGDNPASRQSPPNKDATPAVLDDMATVAPDDSISQASSRRHKKHHRRRTSGGGGGSVVHMSAITLPVREARKERDARSVATALGLRGRS